MLFSQSSLQNADLTDNTGAEIQASNYHGLSRSRSFCLWPAWSQYNWLRYRCCRNNEIHAPLFFHLAVENAVYTVLEQHYWEDNLQTDGVYDENKLVDIIAVSYTHLRAHET